MAVSRNRVDVMGYLGAGPEVKYGDTWVSMTFRVGVTDRWTDEGERKERTEWIRCTMFERKRDGACGPRIAFLSNAMRKGSAVAVEGKLRTRSWKNSDGEDEYATDVNVDDVQLLDRAPDGAR